MDVFDRFEDYFGFSKLLGNSVKLPERNGLKRSSTRSHCEQQATANGQFPLQRPSFLVSAQSLDFSDHDDDLDLLLIEEAKAAGDHTDESCGLSSSSDENCLSNFYSTDHHNDLKTFEKICSDQYGKSPTGMSTSTVESDGNDVSSADKYSGNRNGVCTSFGDSLLDHCERPSGANIGAREKDFDGHMDYFTSELSNGSTINGFPSNTSFDNFNKFSASFKMGQRSLHSRTNSEGSYGSEFSVSSFASTSHLNEDGYYPGVPLPPIDAHSQSSRMVANSGEMCCALCKRNGETKEYYTTHVLKDNRGKVICPILRKYVCPRCQATGDHAHTLRHCPWPETEGKASMALTYKTARSSCGYRRVNRE